MVGEKTLKIPIIVTLTASSFKLFLGRLNLLEGMEVLNK
jgi:hypothetical protein